MTHSPALLLLHIAAATLGLVAGVGAMSLRKGSRWHRLIGQVFTFSMLSMAASAVYLGFMKAQTLNALVGCLTFYLVTTAWWTVRTRSRQNTLLEFGAFLFALALGAALLSNGWDAAHAPSGLKDGEAAPGYFVFGAIALIAAALDGGMLVHGPWVGTHRLVRHLWRMCVPMLIGVISVMPRLYRLYPSIFGNDLVLYAPLGLMVLAIIYWLARVRFVGRPATLR